MAVNLEGPDLASIRDYVGSTPDVATLAGYAESAEYWQEVALRVLRQRRADLNTGDNLTSLNLGGDISLGFKSADLSVITADIRDLENQIAALTGTGGSVSVGRIVRPDRRR